MSEINNNNYSINISDLLKKLVNIEETNLDSKNLKSIFENYNTKKGENSFETLDKEELENFVNDIKKFDENNDGNLDINEAKMFVEKFNENQTSEDKINENNLLDFVKQIFSRFDYYNDKKSAQNTTENIGVGEALSEKNIKMKCIVNGKEETVSITIKLYATNDPKMPHQYQYDVTEGREFCDNIAQEYGYQGENAFQNFMSNSFGKPDSNNYNINFNPQFNKSCTDNKTSATNNSGSQIGTVAGSETVIAVPHGFTRDPKEIYAMYQKPETQEAIQNFMNELESMLEIAEKDLSQILKDDGWTAWLADTIGNIWNNEYTVAGSGNSEHQMKEMLEKAKDLLDKMKSADNSYEGILAHKDFESYYKELSGIDFDPALLEAYTEAKKEYLEKESIISTYRYVHNNLDKVIKTFDNTYHSRLKQRLPDNLYDESGKNISDLGEERYSKAYDELFETFSTFLGLSREKWDKMMNDFEDAEIDPTIFIKEMGKQITESIDKYAKKTLNIDSLDEIDKCEKKLLKHYKSYEKELFGSENYIERVNEYGLSQKIGSAVVSGLAQMALYAGGLSLIKTVSNFSKITNLIKISSGAQSGISYSGAYLTVEITDRLTNGINNTEDLFNFDSMRELGGNALIEFFAGYLFDGIFKEKIFGKIEKNAMERESRDFATQVGENSLECAEREYSRETLNEILYLRGMAAMTGGTKDGAKEAFKELCSGNFNLEDVMAATFVGAVSNALFIRFKNSGFAKEKNPVLGKFIEKAPKKGVKSDLKSAKEVLTPEEYKEFEEFINGVKKDIENELKNKLSDSEYKKIKISLDKSPDEYTKEIIDYYIIEYLIPNQ